MAPAAGSSKHWKPHISDLTEVQKLFETRERPGTQWVPLFSANFSPGGEDESWQHVFKHKDLFRVLQSRILKADYSSLEDASFVSG